MFRPPPSSTLFPYTTLFRSAWSLRRALLERECRRARNDLDRGRNGIRSEEHTSELQSQSNLVCRLLLEKKKSYAWLWSLLAFITNYIPNIGFIIGLVPPTII